MMKNYLRGSPKDRLARLSKPVDSGCVEFIGYRNEDGYGRFRYGERAELSHRAAYQIHTGEIPDGMQVLHHCDNPPCVNPEHLFLGTINDNIQDMVAKGRARGGSGVKHHKAKLNPVKAYEIRWLSAMGQSRNEVARQYGVTKALVKMVCQGKIWRPECHD